MPLILPPHVRVANADEIPKWRHKAILSSLPAGLCMWGLAVLLALSTGLTTRLLAQCSDPHYRWMVKTETDLASLTAKKATVSAMLSLWALPETTGQAKYKCAPRAGRERSVYSVTGWVDRVKRNEDDGDWHIEVKPRQNAPADSCIVVEIPPDGGNFRKAREDFNTLMGSTQTGDEDFSPPVRLRFIGAAFFDGEHRGGATHRDRTDGAHGRCNSSARALWELHPVYFVKRPAT